MANLAAVKEETGRPQAKEMIQNLATDQDTVTSSARAVIEAAEKNGDQASVDLATRRQEAHQKNAWMLRSHLE
ncbi:MAG TPA: ferritin-like domain-containing protein [Candidatus Polarisedimenticolaceae bacterium]|nr:ferritin-like domain-containing protein [Candidatus Polarisedimenticolaceae bacterium]